MTKAAFALVPADPAARTRTRPGERQDQRHGERRQGRVPRLVGRAGARDHAVGRFTQLGICQT